MMHDAQLGLFRAVESTYLFYQCFFSSAITLFTRSHLNLGSWTTYRRCKVYVPVADASSTWITQATWRACVSCKQGSCRNVDHSSSLVCSRGINVNCI